MAYNLPGAHLRRRVLGRSRAARSHCRRHHSRAHAHGRCRRRRTWPGRTVHHAARPRHPRRHHAAHDPEAEPALRLFLQHRGGRSRAVGRRGQRRGRRHQPRTGGEAVCVEVRSARDPAHRGQRQRRDRGEVDGAADSDGQLSDRSGPELLLREGLGRARDRHTSARSIWKIRRTKNAIPLPASRT